MNQRSKMLSLLTLSLINRILLCKKIFCRSASVRYLKEIHESDCYWGILYGYGKNHLGIILIDIEKTL